ncbi:putative oxidoreductase [Nemania sp. FL0916]|nr:putative oxidoreductase [Nemania sp. FL0916]
MATQVQHIAVPPAVDVKRYMATPITQQKPLDFSQYDLPGGKEKLTAQMKAAVEDTGFFYVTNCGLTEEDIDRQFELGKKILDLPEEEKLKYRAPIEKGDYNGYRPLGAIEQFPGLRDNWECYHIFKFIPELQRAHPQLVRDQYAEIERFHRHIHQDVAAKVLRLLARVLEIPEDTLEANHRYDDDTCSSFLRYVKYHARPRAVNAKYDNIYVRGHTDFGSVTFLFSQPVGGLQLQLPGDGGWADVAHVPGSIIVNTADMLHFWSNGYLQSCVHRVVAPPPDQEHLDRYGLIYFLRPRDAMCLESVDSPLLKRKGISTEGESQELRERRKVPVGQWVPIQTKKNWTPFGEQPQDGKGFQSLFR